MIDGGFVLLHRSLLTWEWYDDINTTRLFLHLLLTANYEPQTWKGITIERGQRVASFAKLAEETGLTIKQVRGSLAHLKTTGEVAHKATSKYGVFTVQNYDKYQLQGTQQGSQKAHDRAAEGQSNGQAKGNNGIKAINKSNKEKDIPIGISIKKYGEFANVLLTGEEHGKLVDSLGDVGCTEYIERLSAYLAQTGRAYKSHYAALLNWWRKDGKPVRKTPKMTAQVKEVDFSGDLTAEELF